METISAPDAAEPLPPEVLAQLEALSKLEESHPEEFEAFMKATEDMAQLQQADPEAFRRFAESPELQRAYGEQLRGALDKAPSSGMVLPGAKTALGSGGTEAAQQGKRVVPRAGFVVKTRNQGAAAAAEASGGVGMVERGRGDEEGSKVFINLCVSDEIGAPKTVKRLDADGKEVEGLSIPVSVGELRRAEDRGGRLSYVVDVIVSDESFDEAKADGSGAAKDFLVQLALQYVENKYKLRLDRRYKLPRLAYKAGVGEEQAAEALGAEAPEPAPMPQWVRDPAAAPRIEEVGSSGSGGPDVRGRKGRGQGPPAKESRPPPEQAELYVSMALVWPNGEETPTAVPEGPGQVSLISREKRFIGEGGLVPRATVLTVSGLRVSSLERHLREAGEAGAAGSLQDAFDVDVGAYGLSVRLPWHRPLDVPLPFPPLAAGASAQLLADGSALRVELPTDPAALDWEQRADPGSKAALLAAALGDGDAAEAPEVAEAAEAADPVKAEEAAETAAEKYGLARRGGGGSGSGVAGLDLRAEDDRPVLADEELPEDRFHRSDALSSHYISQREGDREEKKRRHERERREREADGDVEYIDLEDYRPAAAAPERAADEDYADAAQRRGIEMGSRSVAEAVGARAAAAGGAAPALRNTLWAELL